MTVLQWDQPGARLFETGIDRGVLYIPNGSGIYINGYAWNGLTGVSEAPGGAEANPQYADNIKYLNLISAEEFTATIEAFTWPREFDQCDGSLEIAGGVVAGQQNRKSFGLSYRTLLGNDIVGQDFGYKLHLVYGALAAPTEKAYATVSDSPEALTFSWEISTTPVDLPGFKPTSVLTIDSTRIAPAKLAALEAILYGTTSVDPRLPLPLEVQSIVGAVVDVLVPMPGYVLGTKTLTIPTITGVDFLIDGVVQSAGAKVLTVNTVLSARAKAGYRFPEKSVSAWYYSIT